MRKLPLVIACVMLITTFSCMFPVKIGSAAPPYIPSNPSPLNNSIDEPINTDLTWDGGDPDPEDIVTYAVYFGTNTSPPLKDNSTMPKYNPGELEYNTLYYWRIIAWDDNGSSTPGSLWNFRTEAQNQPPNVPNSPNPSNNSINVSVNIDLSWSGGDPDGGDVVTYDVYFGTSSSPPKIGVGNQSGTLYDPGTMGYVTTYYWRIVAWDNHGSPANGPLWTFETSSPANQPPNPPSNPTPSNGFMGAFINATLSWTGGDPDGNPVSYDVYFGTTNPPIKISNNQSNTSYDPGPMLYVTVYYWKIVAWDNQSVSNAGPVWNFTTKSETNHDPDVPNSPLPRDGATGVLVNTDISWVGGDPDPGDEVKYDVYFGTSSPPQKRVSNITTTSYDPGTMTYNTIYYWSIIAWDSQDNSTASPIYHFRTTTQSGGGGEEPPQPPQNIKPVADASAGEPYQGFVNSEIRFDGSSSYDPDGNITSWSWDFGDNSKASGKIVTHSFIQTGTYTITLMVTDDDAETGNDTTYCFIRSPNRPPTKPIISGPINGKKNTQYLYTVVSTDADNDSLQYTFQWEGLISHISGFIPSGTNFSVSHNWSSAGRYDLVVTVTDNRNESSSEITIYIDALQARGAGYLYDIDGDGVYDAFYSDETHKTVLVPNNGENYFIDKDGDGQWDYVYNATFGLTSYQEPRKTPGFEFIFVLSAITVALVLWRKKRFF